MDVFEWNDSYLTGEPVIDQEHHGLVNLINKLFRLQDEHASLERLQPVFDDLLSYAANHFRHEEIFMTDAGCDPRHIHAHKKVHAEFTQQIHTMVSASSNSPDIEIILQFLIGWLAHHILGTDHTMVRQVHTIRDGLNAAQAYDQEHNDTAFTGIGVVLTAMQRLCNIALQRGEALKEEQDRLENLVQARTKVLQDTIQYLEEKNRHLEAEKETAI